MTFDFIEKCHSEANELAKEFSTNFMGQRGRPLTDREQFCIALASGVNIEATKIRDFTDPLLHFKTELASVVWDGSKFLVATLAKKSDDEEASK